MPGNVFFILCILACPVASAQMKLLDEPESKTGVKVITDAKEFFDSAETFIGFDEHEHYDRVNDYYKDHGLTFSASNEDESVVAMAYRFAGGKSGKFSIAAAKPAYQGKMTITFSDANISSVGFHLSHVNPGGTLVDAFDEDGELLGRLSIAKVKGGLAFCGVKSETPIAKLVVSPVEDIDADFAIDDLAFTKAEK